MNLPASLSLPLFPFTHSCFSALLLCLFSFFLSLCLSLFQTYTHTHTLWSNPAASVSAVFYTKYLREGQVRLRPQATCVKEAPEPSMVTENMFCAASPDWATDACQVDTHTHTHTHLPKIHIMLKSPAAKAHGSRDNLHVYSDHVSSCLLFPCSKRRYALSPV